MVDSRNFSRKIPHLFDAFYTRKVTCGSRGFASLRTCSTADPGFPLCLVCAINEGP
jgi:hypothetical protein